MSRPQYPLFFQRFKEKRRRLKGSRRGIPVSVGRSATTCAVMLANARPPSQGPNNTAASAPTAAQNPRLWLQVPRNEDGAQPVRMTSESAFGRKDRKSVV